MIFNSVEFLLFFFPLFLVLYGLTPGKMKNVILLSGSLIFYACGRPEHLALLMLSVLLNYFFALHLGRGARRKKEENYYNTGGKPWNRRRERNRRMLFSAALAYNIGMLAGFKYGVGAEGLPLGISFYTFQIMSYIIDVYCGKYEKENSFFRLAVYITMFPQLLSGPLVGYDEIRNSLCSREFSGKSIQEGLKIFTVGLAEKVLLADRIGLLWREVQVTGFESISTPLAWLAAAAYSMRLYFDFNGYSLMAMGLGRMLGFRLPENFREPYMALSVRDFYRRWHITLGRWFSKYVYVPLGGNRRGEFRTVCNLLVVWVLTSVWHGSSLNFLLWGMVLWLAIVLERQLERLGLMRYLHRGIGKLFSHLYMWVLIPVTWVCFAVTDIGELQVYLGRMFGLHEALRNSMVDWKNALESYGLLLAAGAFCCTGGLRKIFEKLKDTWVGILVLAFLFWFCVWKVQSEGQNPFMYLQF